VLTKPQPNSKSKAIKTPVPIKPPPSNARRVRNGRANRRKVGVLALARWTGKPRTGNAAHRKASASSKPPVVEGEAVGADGEAEAAGAGADDDN
jgi:hypothetical protein